MKDMEREKEPEGRPIMKKGLCVKANPLILLLLNHSNISSPDLCLMWC